MREERRMGEVSWCVADGVMTLHQSRNDNTVFGISKKKREKFEVISWKFFHSSCLSYTTNGGPIL